MTTESGGAACSTRAVRIGAPAKVNLILRVLDRRPDGFHNLWSLMHTVGLEDELRLRLSPETPGIRLSCDDPTLPTDRRNLVVQAAEAVLERAASRAGIEIRLTKRIPTGAGLGGGSSDAAATILGLDRLLGLRWSPDTMVQVGQALGSDVPFFFFAPSARVSGRGEAVTPVPVTGTRWIVLVHPGFPIETRWAYQRLARTRATVQPLSDGLRRLSEAQSVSWEEVLPLMENDFEAALAASHPELRAIEDQLLKSGAERALVSGSGSTVFGVFRDRATAERGRATADRGTGHRAFAVQACTGSLTCQAVTADDPSGTCASRS